MSWGSLRRLRSLPDIRCAPVLLSPGCLDPVAPVRDVREELLVVHADALGLRGEDHRPQPPTDLVVIAGQEPGEAALEAVIALREPAARRAQVAALRFVGVIGEQARDDLDA